ANLATTLGLVLNELATNASKYGALSAPGGRVEITWKYLDPDGGDRRVQLAWTERGGPPVVAGSQPGFGMSFITRSAAYELGGVAAMELAPEGVRCTITFPLRSTSPSPYGEGEGHDRP